MTTARQTARASHALRQVGRDTVSPDTRSAAQWAGDVAQTERYDRLRPAEVIRHPRLERVAPGQRRRMVRIRPSDAPKA